MSPEHSPGLLDRLVALVAAAFDALGLNGKRLLWRWQQRRASLGQAGIYGDMLLRSAKGAHKMCPACRALVPRKATTCPECGETLAQVQAPGFSRLLSNVFPGATATTSLLMLVNGFWFVIMCLAQIRQGSGSLLGFAPELTFRFGSGLNVYSPEWGGGGEWWRLVTPIFLHGGLLHFFFNSYLLLQLGPIAEELFGTKRYWVAYLASGLTGTLFSEQLRPVLFKSGLWPWGPFVNTVGASGAIMGVIGLLLTHGHRAGGMLGDSMKRLVGRLLIYMVVLSFFFNLDNLNHAGGFLCGLLLGLVLPARLPQSRVASVAWQILAFAGVLLVLVAFYEVALQGQLSLER